MGPHGADGVHLKTIQKHKKINQELQTAIDLGRAKDLAKVSNSLFESAQVATLPLRSSS
jgi:hypothetical protein